MTSPKELIQTDLGKRMLARADKDGLPAHHDLRLLAHAFDRAAEGHYATPQTVSTIAFMTAWSAARSTWCRYTGEPLV